MRAFAAALAVSAALVVTYLALGGTDTEPRRPPNPCTLPSAGSAAGGLTGTLERVGLNALAGAACDLGITREKLLLGLAGEEKLKISEEQRTAAFRAGLTRAVAQEQQAGRINGPEAFLLRGAIQVLPIDALLQRLFGTKGLAG